MENLKGINMLPQGLLQDEQQMMGQAPQEPAMPSAMPPPPPMQGQPKDPQMIIEMLMKMGVNPQALQSPEGQQLLKMLMS